MTGFTQLHVFFFNEFCNFWFSSKLDLFPWSRVRQSVENKEFQGPADIFKAIAKRAGLMCLLKELPCNRKHTEAGLQHFCWGASTLSVKNTLTCTHCLALQPQPASGRKFTWALSRFAPELWRQFQALFLFHPCQLVAASSKLAFSCPCSFSCLFLHMPKLCFQFRSAKSRLYLKKFFCDWTQGKAGESPKTNKNPCHPFVELAQRPESELP